MSMCLLRAIKRKLPTKSFLKKLNIIPTDQCVLHNGATETMQQLYFECCYSSYIWKLCKFKLGIKDGSMGDLMREANKIKENFRKKKKITILARMTCWKERDYYLGS